MYTRGGLPSNDPISELFEQFLDVFSEANYSATECKRGWAAEGIKWNWRWSNGGSNEVAIVFPGLDKRGTKHEKLLFPCRFENLRNWVTGSIHWDQETAVLVVAHHVKIARPFFSQIDLSKLSMLGDVAQAYERLQSIQPVNAPWKKLYLNHDGKRHFEPADSADPKAVRLVRLAKNKYSELCAGLLTEGGIGFRKFQYPHGVGVGNHGVGYAPAEGAKHTEFLFYKFDYFQFLERLEN